MSVDCSPGLMYGWKIEDKEKTSRFYDLNEEDFEPLDGKYEENLGHYYAAELVGCDDGYSDESSYHIGVEIPFLARVEQGERLAGFRNMGLEEFCENALKLKEMEPALRELYFDVMGDYPKEPPYVDMYASWW